MTPTIEEQKAVIAHLIKYPELHGEVGLDSNEFNTDADYAPTQEVYNAVMMCIDNKQIPSTTLVARYSGLMPKHIQNYVDFKYEVKNIPTHIKLIRDEVIRKELVTFGEDIINMAELIEEPTSAPREIEERLAQINFEGDVDLVESGFGNLLDKSVAKSESEIDMPMSERLILTPYDEFNERFGGLFRGDMTILAAETGVGKTSMASDLITYALQNDVKVASVILEMNEEQIVQRQIVRESQSLTMDIVRMGEQHNRSNMRQDYYNSVRSLSQYKDLWNIYGTENVTLDRILAIGRKQALTGTALFTIDYLQLVQNEKYAKDRVLAIGMGAQAIAQLAKATNMSTLLLAQLNRSISNRQDRRPVLSDLKDSGYIEQAADGILFAYREGSHNPDAENPNKAELHKAKSRNGSTGVIELLWNGRGMTFTNPPSTY